MLFKPFRTPLLERQGTSSEPKQKKQRITAEDAINPQITKNHSVSKQPHTSNIPQARGSIVESQPLEGNVLNVIGDQVRSCYKVLWRKTTAKKRKAWEGDGILLVIGITALLQDVDSGRDMGKTNCNHPLLPGSSLRIGVNEIEVDSVLSKSDYLALKRPSRGFTKEFQARPHDVRTLVRPVTIKSGIPPATNKKAEHDKSSRESVSTTVLVHPPYRKPSSSLDIVSRHAEKKPCPRHDPTAENAIVMKRPAMRKGRDIVDVVVDPLLTQHLREHQREGVKFMYECVMGMRDFDGQGAILADEMGLGKTLQTIALLWTLLKQNPYSEEPPVIRKALVVCPVTLINNWRKEFRKWLGNERIGVFVVDDTKKRISDFTMGKSYSVMIIGYERLRSVQEDLMKGSGIDIVIADEGHRLKTAKNKSAQAIKALNTTRRVILSGTPIQNDLGEFFTMVDFVNPDLLGTFKKFTKEFEGPIVRSRQPEAMQNEIENGKAKSEELAALTRLFILRRTADVLVEYLPRKTEYVLFCRPTEAQVQVYHRVLSCPAFQAALGNSEASLQLITVLKKVCNSPVLLNKMASEDASKAVSPLTTALLAHIPPRLLRNSSTSAKLRTLDQLLHTIRTQTSEKVVLVSNYTATLDILETLLTSVGHSFLRLDGSTPSSKRQDLVDTFNRTPASSHFAFLLSAKSGGLGLNLVGASRLILFDVDWNPATDLQAMARIHRDGQKRPCIIYTFLLAGSIDEKIWQRQVTKLGLASNIMEQKGGVSSFSREELSDLFRLDEGLSCQTHDLIKCRCRGRGLPVPSFSSPLPLLSANEEGSSEDLPSFPAFVQANKIYADQRVKEEKGEAIDATRAKTSEPNMQSLMDYIHIDSSKFAAEEDKELETLVEDDVLLNTLKDEGNTISFVFAKTSK